MLLAPPVNGTAEAARRSLRPVYMDGHWIDAPVYARLDLPPMAVIPGPAILEQPDTTIVIDADLEGAVDRFGNVILSRKAR
jgi:N-methylhydantoinase A